MTNEKRDAAYAAAGWKTEVLMLGAVAVGELDTDKAGNMICSPYETAHVFPGSYNVRSREEAIEICRIIVEEKEPVIAKLSKLSI